MKALRLLALAAFAAACTPTPRGPQNPAMPIVIASEEQDEWFHGHCKYLGLLEAPNETAPEQGVARGATMGELIYVEGASSHVALFSCRPNPGWVGAGPAANEPAASASPPDESPPEAPTPAAAPPAAKAPAAQAAAAPSRPAARAAGPRAEGAKPKPAPKAEAKWL